MTNPAAPAFGSEKLRLPDDLRGPLLQHLADLKAHYKNLDWAGECGWGVRPAIVVIDLALWWTDPNCFPMGSNVDPIVDASAKVLEAGRTAGIPIFFTTYDYDPAEPPTPHTRKCQQKITPDDLKYMEIDPRLGRRESEKIVRKKYASAFNSTNLHTALAALKVDTLIVCGVSTSHCVYATCRDATDHYHVIVPREAVGERCEIMHEVNLLDIDIDLGDVLPVDNVVTHLNELVRS